MGSPLQATAGALVEQARAITVSPLSYRADLIKRASARLPVTGEGLPVGYYRPDFLPNSHASEGPNEAEILKVAYVELNYEFGYPTLMDGRPFWHKFEFEPSFAHALFNIYLDQLTQGPRDLALLASNAEVKELFERMQEASGEPITNAFSKALETLNEFSALYYWRYRAKAYDIYKEAAYRHIRLRRQKSTEDEHFQLATQLLEQLRAKVFASPKFFEDMAPKTAVDLLNKLVAIQRISTGLPASGPLAQKEIPEDTSFEMILRTLQQKAGQSGNNVYDQLGQAVGGGKGVLSRVLEDPTSTDMMQEMVIRVTKTMRSNEDQHNQGQRRGFKGRNRPSSDQTDAEDVDVVPNGGENDGFTGENAEPGPISSEDLTGYNVDGAPGAH